MGVRIPPSAPIIYGHLSQSEVVNWSSTWSTEARLPGLSSPVPFPPFFRPLDARPFLVGRRRRVTRPAGAEKTVGRALFRRRDLPCLPRKKRPLPRTPPRGCVPARRSTPQCRRPVAEGEAPALKWPASLPAYGWIWLDLRLTRMQRRWSLSPRCSALIAELDEFKGAWRALSTLADSRAECAVRFPARSHARLQSGRTY